MTDKIVLTLVPFTPNEDNFQNLYENELYDTPFVVKSIHGQMECVQLGWEQDYGNNWFLHRGDHDDQAYIEPCDISYIEERK